MLLLVLLFGFFLDPASLRFYDESEFSDAAMAIVGSWRVAA